LALLLVHRLHELLHKHPWLMSTKHRRFDSRFFFN
jgi:hypothetical protein